MSELSLFNSLSHQKELFTSAVSGCVNMYVCGVTVYDYCHIGHARVMIVFDVIARHLRSLGYQLNYTRNITDIDDKIIRRAHECGISPQELAARFIQAMHDDERALLCLPPDQEPCATEYIDDMITFIADLIERGYAYCGEHGDVYFSIATFPDYGKLSKQNLNDLRAGERVEINSDKRDPLDFVLWKAAKSGEPSWASPWGEGRPGWHIECSVMAGSCLNDCIDLHGGGMDLKFPHHECEIAQSEAHLGHQHVRYWLHNGFVQINNEKMSKSLGNFFTIRDVLQHFDGETLRLFVLNSHYRGPLNYGDEYLKEAQASLHRLYSTLREDDGSGELLPEYACAFDEAMNDDFNTPKALAVLFDVARQANKAEDHSAQQNHLATLRQLGGRLGLLQRDPQSVVQGNTDDCAEIQALIDARLEAKKAHDYARADAIRAELQERGIELEDRPEGTRWTRRI